MQDYVNDAKRKYRETKNTFKLPSVPRSAKISQSTCKWPLKKAHQGQYRLPDLQIASENKNEMLHEHIMMELSKLDPNSDESRRYFSLKRKQFIDEAEKLVQQRNDSDVEDVV
ncbi:hypothetical protein Ae201684P_000009 [Aphanomyces euteiches]|nr:hypothetical protein Ae201684P_000009 [Aphanomyces euteiches]